MQNIQLGPRPEDFIWAGGIEDTFIPQGRPGLRPLEEYELTQHYEQWRGDLDRAASLGVRALRWGVPWYRVEREPGVFDWAWIDEVLDYMVRDLGITPIVDLMHYGTPLWLEASFADPAYPQRVAAYAGAFAERSFFAIRRLLRICRQRSMGLVRKMGTGPGARFSMPRGLGRNGFRAR